MFISLEHQLSKTSHSTVSNSSPAPTAQRDEWKLLILTKSPSHHTLHHLNSAQYQVAPLTVPGYVFSFPASVHWHRCVYLARPPHPGPGDPSSQPSKPHSNACCSLKLSWWLHLPGVSSKSKCCWLTIWRVTPFHLAKLCNFTEPVSVLLNFLQVFTTCLPTGIGIFLMLSVVSYKVDILQILESSCLLKKKQSSCLFPFKIQSIKQMTDKRLNPQ